MNMKHAFVLKQITLLTFKKELSVIHQSYIENQYPSLLIYHFTCHVYLFSHTCVRTCSY